MFNLGGDDKEKLKENMEEIKDLVNNQEQGESLQQNVDDETADIPEEGQVNQDLNSQGDSQNLDLENDASTGNNQPIDNQVEQPESSVNPERGLREQNRTENSLNQSSNTGSTNTGSRSFDSNNLSSESSGTPDFEDETSESEDETLFLEVDEFNDIKEMVDEMKYLSREMNDLMENLEGGVEEDRRIESEAQDVIDEFSNRRDNIDSSIN